MIADDQDLPLNPALPGRAVGSQHVDVEVVVAGEADSLRMQRNRLTGGDVPAHDGLGAIVDDRHRHPAEVRERASVAVEEGLQSWLVVKQQNGSREYDSVMWNE